MAVVRIRDLVATDPSTGWKIPLDKAGEANARQADFTRIQPVANVLNYGALGNDSQIDGPYIKAALAAADDVYCPPGIYRFDVGQLIQMKGKRLRGCPGKTIFKHVGTATDQVKNSFFYLGDGHPAFFDDRKSTGDKYKRLAVTGAVPKGARVLTMTTTPTGGDATDLGAGKMVWVRDAVEFTRPDAWAQPDFAQLVRVESLSGATLTLERPVNEPLASAIVSPIGTACSDGYLSTLLGTTVVAGVCEDCVFEDIIFEGGLEAFSRTCCYRCVFRNIEHRRALCGPGLNAFTESLVDNYKVEYSLVMAEIKMCSSDSIIRSFHGTYRPIAGVDFGGTISSDNNTLAITYPIDIGERSNRINFIDLRMDIGPQWTGAQRCLDISDAWDITFDSNDFDISGGSNPAVLGIRGNGDATTMVPTKNITYRNGNYRIGIAKAANCTLQGYSTAPLTGIHYINNRWSGVNTSTSTHIYAIQYVSDWLVQDDVRNAFYVYGDKSLGAMPARRTTFSMRF